MVISDYIDSIIKIVYLFINKFNMIDEEKQATFAGEFMHYSVALGMREKELEIKVLDNQALLKLHKTIGP